MTRPKQNTSLSLTRPVRSRLQQEALWRRISCRRLVLVAGLCLLLSNCTSQAVATETATKEIETYKLYTHIKLLDSKEFICINALWTKESNWNSKAKNKRSTAYGIPQLLNLKEIDPYKQIDKGLIYIQSRYSTACNAWSFYKAKGYY